MRRTASVALALLTAFVLLAPPTLAEKEEGTRTLEWGDSVQIHINNTLGEALDISYDVKVTDGGPINVYFVDQADLDDYNDPNVTDMDYYVRWSSLDTERAVMEWTWLKEGDFYIIIDNRDIQSMDNVTVDYKVTWGPEDTSGDTDWARCVVILVVVIIVAFAIMLGWMWWGPKKR